MMRFFAADKVVAARLSDTGGSATFVLADEGGAEVSVSLPAGQLDSLAATAQSLAGRLAEAAPAGQVPGGAIPVERWAVRPEPDDEHVVLAFRLAKGVQIELRLTRAAAQGFTRALSSLLGRLTPAAPSKSRH